MKLADLDAAVAASKEEEDEYGADEGELAQDLGEALELLGDCQEMFERLLGKTAKRRPVNAIDVKDIRDLSLEVMAFIEQWTLPADKPLEDNATTGITSEVDDEFPF